MNMQLLLGKTRSAPALTVAQCLSTVQMYQLFELSFPSSKMENPELYDPQVLFIWSLMQACLCEISSLQYALAELQQFIKFDCSSEVTLLPLSPENPTFDRLELRALGAASFVDCKTNDEASTIKRQAIDIFPPLITQKQSQYKKKARPAAEAHGPSASRFRHLDSIRSILPLIFPPHHLNLQPLPGNDFQPLQMIADSDNFRGEPLLHESSIAWLFDNINKMLGLRRKPAGALEIPTLQLKEMISNKFHKLVNEHIINEAQEELVASYATALKRDCLREEAIKEQLNNQFFNVHKNRKRKYYLQEKLTANENAHLEMRQRLSKEFKRSINGKEAKRRTLRSPNLSARYEQTLTPSTASPRRRISCTPSLEGRSSVFSCQIDSIIESAQRVDAKPSRFKRDVVTATERQRLMQRTDHSQKEEIIEKIIEKDVDDFIKYSSAPAQHCSPEERKRFYEEVKMRELSNFDKYNMSFVSYMRQKTHNNIEKSIYNEKVRKKETYVEKFQKFILSEFKFSEEAKRRLEKIFKSIELEYKRPSKNREFSERVPK